MSQEAERGPDARDQLDDTMTQIACQTSAVLHVYRHPGTAARRVILRDARNEHGAQVEAVQLSQDGTLLVTGHYTGPGVSQFFSAAITSYERVYLIAAERVAALLTLLGGQEGDDVLDLLATYHHQHGGVSDLAI